MEYVKNSLLASVSNQLDVVQSLAANPETTPTQMLNAVRELYSRAGLLQSSTAMAMVNAGVHPSIKNKTT